MPQRQTYLLAEATPGSVVRIARVPHGTSGERLRYLESLGVVPGAAVTVQTVAPFDGPVTLNVSGEVRVVGFGLASLILVESIES